MRFLFILKLKFLDLIAMRGLIFSLLLLPLGMGMIAGSANLANREPDLRLALVDEDQTAASLEFQDRLSQHGWQVRISDPDTARRLMLRDQVDGILTIEAGFAQSLVDLTRSHLSFEENESSLVTRLMQEIVAVAVLPMHARENLLSRLGDQYQQIGQLPPVDLDQRFDDVLRDYLKVGASLEVDYVGDVKVEPTLTSVIADYAMEVFLISIYAVLGGITLTRHDMRRRLASTRKGLWVDFATTQLSLMLLGLLQILVYSLAMNQLMQTDWRWIDQLYLAVFLWFMLGFSQILQLIEPSLRLYLSLLILLILGMAGGCFFQLSEPLLRRVGQYTPHGWALSSIRGYATLHPLWPILLASVFFVFGYQLQRHRARQPD